MCELGKADRMCLDIVSGQVGVTLVVCDVVWPSDVTARTLH